MCAIKSLSLILTDQAIADLKDIRDFIVQENPNAAAAFIKDLTDKLKDLSDKGATGSPRDWVSAGLRGFPYKGRCFYFRIINDKMIVVRILHGKQDVTAQAFF